MYRIWCAFILTFFAVTLYAENRNWINFNENWKFTRGNPANALAVDGPFQYRLMKMNRGIPVNFPGKAKAGTVKPLQLTRPTKVGWFISFSMA